MTIAMLAEADTGTDCHFRLGKEFFGELDRAEVAVLLGNPSPGKHGGFGKLDRPAQLVESWHKDVAAALVVVYDLFDAALRAFERGNGGDLNGREGSIIEVALDATEGGDEFFIADHEADAPTWHVVALGEREELDGDLFGLGNLKDAGSAVAVEDKVGVGEVVDDVNAEFAAECNDALEESEVDALGGGVGGEVENEDLRTGLHARKLVLKAGEKLVRRGVGDGNALDARACNDGAEDVDRIAGIGDRDGVGVVEHGEAEVGDALFGADGNNGLGLGVDVDVVASLVPVGDGTAKARDSAREGVAMGLGLLGRLDELIYDGFGGRTVGVTHTEIDDVFATLAGCCLQFAGDVEHIRREPGQPSKLFHDVTALPLDS